MCRHLAWLGEPRALAQFVTEPPHSLVRQSYAATQLLRGSVCADGFGIGWYPADETTPARYRRPEPIWADTDLGRFAEAVRSRAIIAAVRNGTPGIPGGVASTQPVAARGLLASHNGYVADFHRHARRLRDGLPEDLYAALTGESDSETFLLLAIDGVRREGELATGLESAIDMVLRIAPGSSLCVVMTDGRELIAARMTDGQPCDSLYVRRHADGVVVASEPLDDAAGWSAVPEQAITRVAGPTAAVDGAVR